MSLPLKKCISITSLALGTSENKFSGYFSHLEAQVIIIQFIKYPPLNSWSSIKTERLKPWTSQRTLETPLDCKEIKPVHPKGNQHWIVIRRTDAEAETPILWPLDVKGRLTGKAPDAGRDWGQEEKGDSDEMVGWHHQLNGHESEVKSFSRVRLFATPWTVAHQAPLSMGFSRQG